MSDQTPKRAENEEVEVTANPQPTADDQPPIPQPPTDGFPVGEDLTSRVPGKFEDVNKPERD